MSNLSNALPIPQKFTASSDLVVGELILFFVIFIIARGDLGKYLSFLTFTPATPTAPNLSTAPSDAQKSPAVAGAPQNAISPFSQQNLSITPNLNLLQGASQNAISPFSMQNLNLTQTMKNGTLPQ